MTTEAPAPEARIAKALEFASEYGAIDGGHHKMESRLPVPGWPHYEVSDLGRVRSLDHTAIIGRGWLSRRRPG
jgi:hypothetical protein